MYAKFSLLSRTVGLLAGTLVALSGAFAAEAGKVSAETDALPVFAGNFITLSGQVSSLTGSKPAFAARTQNAKTSAGGIEALSIGKDISKETTLQIDGRALAGAEDYLAQFRLTKNEVGSFEAGYKRFRTFYDGAGGFFPINNAWLPLYPRALFVDRGKFYVNGTIALPNAPVFTFRYANETRSGRKDSTIWGDTDQTGIPIWSLSSLNPISANRKIIPAYMQLGERQETWEASVRHSVGKTRGMLSVIGNRINNLDYRLVDRYPGELKPYPAIPSNPPTLVSPLLANNRVKGFDQHGFKETGLTVTGKVETELNDKVTIYASGSYHDADIDLADSRLTTGDINTATGFLSLIGGYNTPSGRPPYSYTGMGAMKLKILTGNIGVEAKPAKDFYLNAALKAEQLDRSGNFTASYTNQSINLTTGNVTQYPVTAPSSSKTEENVWTPELNVRYTGIKNLSLYGTFDYRDTPSDERLFYTSPSVNTTTGVVAAGLTTATDKVKEKHYYYRAGASWLLSPSVTLRAEVFLKDHENSFTGYGTSYGSYYILDFDTKGARLTATVKATPELAFTTRFVTQVGKGSVAEDGYIKGDSNDTKTYHFAETVDWNPNKQFYLQGNVNVVYSSVVTVYGRSTGLAADVLHNSDNNYWNGSVVAGFVLDKETDAQLLCTYYKADNYNAAMAPSTDPYGAGVRDYSITVGVKHKFSDRTVGSARIGYFNSNNETTGGFTNYKGPVAYVSLTHAF